MKKITILSRVIKSGVNNFRRNGWLSVATASVIMLTLFALSLLVMVNVVASEALTSLQDKVDVSVYFKTEAPEPQILRVRAELVELNEIKSVEYVSREEALTKFKEKHEDNPLLTQSLEELGSNPLQASLNIKAFNPEQYPQIASFLEGTRYSGLIDKINYWQNREIISRLSLLTQGIRQGGLGLSLILAVIAVLVTFNTIRLTMYSHRQEIEIMKLVGATNWYVRLPFIVEGVIYGLVACLATLIILTPLIILVSPRITSFLPESDLLADFKSNFLLIIGLQILVSLALGAISSLIAIRRYLKV
ncbi:MAG TPA: ABC transporter permease [Candidatus Portnoybacteria bacterium]|nr:ABC transporter permease [Candidatus Portnoybacteria bacterium]